MAGPSKGKQDSEESSQPRSSKTPNGKGKGVGKSSKGKGKGKSSAAATAAQAAAAAAAEPQSSARGQPRVNGGNGIGPSPNLVVPDLDEMLLMADDVEDVRPSQQVDTGVAGASPKKETSSNNTSTSNHSSILESMTGPLSKRLRTLHTMQQQQHEVVTIIQASIINLETYTCHICNRTQSVADQRLMGTVVVSTLTVAIQSMKSSLGRAGQGWQSGQRASLEVGRRDLRTATQLPSGSNRTKTTTRTTVRHQRQIH